MDPFWLLTAVEGGLGVVTFVILWWIPAPYGRNLRPGWGPTIPSRLGWVVMESPAVIWFAAVFMTGQHRTHLLSCVFLALWLLHYVHRAFVWPMRMRLTGRRMPVVVALLAVAFNVLNATINAAFISHWAAYGPADWRRPSLWIGLMIFVGGLATNVYADEVLRGLRRDGDGHYRLPSRGPFRFVTSANYLGEIVEWIGWALMTRSPAGWAFAFYTAGNLAPRARSHHRWYRTRFEEMPKNRRALIPFVW